MKESAPAEPSRSAAPRPYPCLSASAPFPAPTPPGPPFVDCSTALLRLLVFPALPPRQASCMPRRSFAVAHRPDPKGGRPINWRELSISQLRFGDGFLVDLEGCGSDAGPCLPHSLSSPTASKIIRELPSSKI